MANHLTGRIITNQKKGVYHLSHKRGRRGVMDGEKRNTSSPGEVI